MVRAAHELPHMPLSTPLTVLHLCMCMYISSPKENQNGHWVTENTQKEKYLVDLSQVE